MNQQICRYFERNKENIKKNIDKIPVIFDIDQSLLASGLKDPKDSGSGSLHCHSELNVPGF